MEFHYKYYLIFSLTYDIIHQNSDMNIVTFLCRSLYKNSFYTSQYSFAIFV